MGTQLRQWTTRLFAAGALPVVLTLGLSAAASAQPVVASHASSTGHASYDRGYEVYGPYDSYRECYWHQREFHYHHSYCTYEDRDGHHHYHGDDDGWYLYVWYGR